MSTLEPKPGERITNVHVSDDTLTANLLDGRSITVPIAWFPRLLHATPEQRDNWRLMGAGFVIHWPDIDEHLSSHGLLHGAPSPATSIPSLGT